MEKMVLKLKIHKGKEEAMKIVPGFAGVDSIAMDMKDMILTVTGDMDAANMVVQLKKKDYLKTMISFEPAKEEKQKDEPKKGVLELEIGDGMKKDGMKKALMIVSNLKGVDSIAMDMKEKILTVKGDMDPIPIGPELRAEHYDITMVSFRKFKEEKKAEHKKGVGKNADIVKNKEKKADEKK